MMLCTVGTMEQYHACGLKTVKDQMRLRKLIKFNDNTTTVTTQSSTSSNSSSQGSTPSNKRKLAKKKS